MILYCSSMLTGSHDATKLPVVLLGGGGGKIQGGRVLDHRNDPNRKMCSLFLSLLDKADVHLEVVRRLDGAAVEPLIRIAGSRLLPCYGIKGFASRLLSWHGLACCG